MPKGIGESRDYLPSKIVRMDGRNGIRRDGKKTKINMMWRWS